MQSPPPAAKFLFVHEQGAHDNFQSALVTTTACWLAGNQVRYFPAIFSLCRKRGCAVWKLLEVALDKLSLLTATHHYRFHDDFQSSQLCPRWSNTCADCQSSLLFPWWLPVITALSTLKQHLCWLPVITIVPMMTSSHHYCSHNDFQSSLLFPWWLPVISIVPMMMMTSSSSQ